jgi:hypothetical protein
VERRWLIPMYRLNNCPVAWVCAVCAKLFTISLEESAEASHLLPPPHVKGEFRLHNCELQLRQHFPDLAL